MNSVEGGFKGSDGVLLDMPTLLDQVEKFVHLLGVEWVGQRIASLSLGQIADRDAPDAWFWQSIASLREWITTLEKGKPIGDSHLLLRLASVCAVVAEIQSFEGGIGLTKRMADLLRADQYEGFEDALFEAEAALFWSKNTATATTIEFPRGHHPDFWLSFESERGPQRVAAECKRLRQKMDEFTLDHLARALSEPLASLADTAGAFRAIVWLHESVDSYSDGTLLETLTRLVRKAIEEQVSEDVWLTECLACGSAQVSVARFVESSELLKRPMEISDVPICQYASVVGSARLNHDDTGPPAAAMRFLLCVRSDVLPNRVGALERNLFKAVGQLTRSTADLPGVVCLRLRPPRGLGDLFEADGIVRRVLREREVSHVAAVALFWSEDDHSETYHPSSAQGILIHKRETKAHFVSNPLSRLSLSAIDSYSTAFPPFQGALSRDPETGALIPYDDELFHALEATPEMLEVSDVDGAFTLALEMIEPMPPKEDRGVFALAKVGARGFAFSLGRNENLLVLEIQAGRLMRSATIDLRAMRGRSILCASVELHGEDWQLLVSFSEVMAPLRARSVRIQGVFL